MPVAFSERPSPETFTRTGFFEDTVRRLLEDNAEYVLLGDIPSLGQDVHVEALYMQDEGTNHHIAYIASLTRPHITALGIITPKADEQLLQGTYFQGPLRPRGQAERRYFLKLGEGFIGVNEAVKSQRNQFSSGGHIYDSDVSPTGATASQLMMTTLQADIAALQDHEPLRLSEIGKELAFLDMALF